MTALPHETAPPPGPAAALAGRIRDAIPPIETARLRLRAPRIEDFAVYAAIACSERARFMMGPMSREGAWDDFTRMCVTWLWRGHGAWMIEDRETGATRGVVLLGFEPGDREPELGFALAAGAEGRGIATEAAAAARDFARDVLGLPSLVSYIHPGNAASVAVAVRLGARPDGESDGMLVYRHLPQDHAHE
jgi:RimJ/RimL family protein N-acetyltransferase